MSIDDLGIAIAGALATRRHKTRYQGKRRTRRNKPATYLLSPAAVQLVTGTHEPVPATADDATGLMRIRDIHPTGQFTTIPAVNGVNEGSAL